MNLSVETDRQTDRQRQRQTETDRQADMGRGWGGKTDKYKYHHPVRPLVMS